MNDEIKEILAYFEKYVKITYMHDSEPMLNWKDLKIVLDYITNLQQENERLEQIYTDEYNLRHKLSLELSIEKDKTLELSHHLSLYSSEETMLKQIDDYKSRIEKAVEYILNRELVDEPENYVLNGKELLNILNGKE